MNKNINVLEVINSLKPTGGAETFAINLCLAMNKKVNLKVAILFNEHTKAFIDTLEQNNIEYFFLEKKKGIDFKCAKRLKDIIIKHNIHFIHTENNALITTYLATRKNNLRKKVVILHTIHTLPGLEGGKISNYLMKHIFRKKIAIPVNIIDDDNVKKYYKLQYVPVIENGVDISKFANTNELKNRKTDLVMFARFEEQKNHALAIKIFETVIKKVKNFKAVLYGSGSLKPEIEKTIAEKGLSESIILAGQVDNRKIPEILSNAKISFLCSVWEMKSISIIEALSSGCIMLASDCLGNKTIINDGVNGFLISNEFPEKYSDKIIDIITCPNKYQQISYNAVESSKKYSIDQTAEEYLKLFVENAK